MTLAVRHVSIQYAASNGEQVHALDDVSLDIADDEFVVGLGASGCGKSTLLNAIAGFVPVTSGSIDVDGVPVTGPGADRGMVFQKDTLLPWASTLDNVAFGLRLQGVARRERRERAGEWLRLVGLETFADSPPYRLSGGMRQRVGLARALLADPKILLMDEPLGALDSMTRETMQELIVRLWARTRKRMLFITHSVEEALFLGTKIVVFSRRPGRIVARINARHVRAFLAGEDASAIKASPDFVAQRQEIRQLIHEHAVPA